MWNVIDMFKGQGIHHTLVPPSFSPVTINLYFITFNFVYFFKITLVIHVNAVKLVRASQQSGKRIGLQCKRCKRHRFDPWVKKILSNRKWQPASVFLPVEFHGQSSLVGYSPWNRGVGCDWVHTHISSSVSNNCYCDF